MASVFDHKGATEETETYCCPEGLEQRHAPLERGLPQQSQHHTLHTLELPPFTKATLGDGSPPRRHGGGVLVLVLVLLVLLLVLVARFVFLRKTKKKDRPACREKNKFSTTQVK